VRYPEIIDFWMGTIYPNGERSMINIAVVGSGYWGKNLVRNFHGLDALVAICDKDPKVLADFQEMYPALTTYQSLENLLDVSLRQIDAVAIATPAATHYELVKKCLLAGKHVFVEKPLALTAEQGEDLVQVAEKNQLTLMVGHILQYHRAVIKLKELIDSGELGKIQYLYSNRLNIGKIRAEENILWSFAPHDISVILMLLQEMPVTVCATGGEYLQRQIPDTTLTMLDFPSGVRAHIFVSWLHPFKEQKLVVVGDKKMAVFDDIGDEKLLLYPHKIEWVQRIPVASKEEAEAVPVETEEPLRAECGHFLECVETRRLPKTDGREGLGVLKVLEASQRSLNESGQRIELGAITHQKANDQHVVEPVAPEKRKKLEAEGIYIHESSYVDEGVEIGFGTRVWHFSHILSGSRIGKNCNIGQNVVIGPDVSVGDGCKIQNNVSLYKGVTLEDEVFCGPSMVFTNVYNPRSAIRRMDEVRPTLVKKGATIGANATIICGITIGTYAFIGTGAIVLKDVPDYALMVGNPAMQKGWMCACGIQLDFKGSDAVCEVCNQRYQKIGPEKVVEA
jgi:UDP-2-acetamido-3-amino-2,3-dideoxy-glucuronate N-acetyltransferase